MISSWNGVYMGSDTGIITYNALLNKETKKKRPLTLLRLLNIICDMEEHNKVSSPRVKEYIEKDDFILNCQLELLHNEISIGHFLEKLR
ncbi:Uncharacterized protein OBRU01_17038 [Operophtera brumata]|uniref:Uncharacterized protein n=1 Tax=Operophtera brumata TaxID=104452 RepID=A0A0L7L1K5_OPEBR|nr:Uncharacterized protein OBRU01_17038 [Operophtera brumata]